ncbi:MAG: NADH-quinone oxidoreductase subunit NuoK [Chloroflexi bacterium]|nr:MAG: NADH-quinone oxidoreductase subunit NuoK [Chloroflexota bacterium]
MVPPSYYLILSAVLFAVGAAGVLVRRNALVLFMCVEMMLNAANLALITYSRALEDVEGQVFVLLVMAVAAAEVAVGLAIVVSLYRHKATADVDEHDRLRDWVT